MVERIQYPAIDDLEAVVRSLARTAKGPVAAVFDPKRGWCVTDEVKVEESKHGALEVAFTCQTYADWFRDSVSEACAQLFAVRFIPGTLVGKLFKVAAGAEAGSKAVGQERKQEQPPQVAAPKGAAQDGKPGEQGVHGAQRREGEAKRGVTPGVGAPQVQQASQVQKHRPNGTGQGPVARPQPPAQAPSHRVPAPTSFLPRKAAAKPSTPLSPAVAKQQKLPRNKNDDFPELPV
jgi:hypothetical protein